MSERRAVLVVDDNRDFLRSVSQALSGVFEVILATDIPSAKRSATQRISAAFLDVRLDDKVPQNRDGLELLAWFREQYPDTPIIMMTAVDETAVAVEAMKMGAADFLVKTRPQAEELVKAVETALERSQLAKKVKNLETRLEQIEPTDLIGASQAMHEVRKLIDLVAADGQCSVLIRGQTGTGKEIVARAIHKSGSRRNAPFVAVSIPTLSKEMLARELFGHEKGAFTGADRRSIGYIEAASGGVLFVDEIGDLTTELQVSLLRVFESREFVRVGGTAAIPVDFQLVAATHRNLEEAVARGTFREDLYYRLKSVEIELPPLSERGDDVSLLAQHFLESLKRAGRTSIVNISKEALASLQGYDWPGNARELKKCLDTAIVWARVTNEDVIQPCHLPSEVRAGKSSVRNDSEISFKDLPDGCLDVEATLARAELTYIEKALRKKSGRVAEASSLLGYHDRFTMRRRIDSLFGRFPSLANEFRRLKRKVGS